MSRPVFAATMFAAVALMAAAGAVRPGFARELLEGPVAAEVERVVDGDTLAIRAKVWIGQEVTVLVRLRGIDAPELRGACDEEIARARAAAAALATIVGPGPVILRRIEGDKYFGRVVADVAATGGADLGAMLVRRGLARVYDGGARSPWCPEAQVDGMAAR